MFGVKWRALRALANAFGGLPGTCPASGRWNQERGGGEAGESDLATARFGIARAWVTGAVAGMRWGIACRKSGPESAEAETPSSPPRHFLTAMAGTSSRRGAGSSAACCCSGDSSPEVEQQPVPQQQATGFSAGAHGQIFAPTAPETEGECRVTGTTIPPANCSNATIASSVRAARPLDIER